MQSGKSTGPGLRATYQSTCGFIRGATRHLSDETRLFFVILNDEIFMENLSFI